MKLDFKETCVEVLKAISPIVLVILLVEITFIGISLESLARFLVGTLMVALGFVFFLSGVKIGLLPMGEAIGSELPKSASLLLIIGIAFVFGFFATVAEPDVQVLSCMIDIASNGEIGRSMLLGIIGIGVGFFVAMAMIRIVLGVPIAYLLAAGYIAVIMLAIWIPPKYLAISFDAGGVTTGPLTVPFILALGLGVSSVLGGRSRLSDGFGLIGLASIGPILGVMVMGVVVA
ncbi:MAG TPA: DUF1538 domain-containing protein [Methanolinea sp.]|nr:DUF1538 domain-containing protein [Methanolinea sp.]HQK55121.1 DUF1538 domain-containing protein [Methanolinea sp.]